MIRPATESDLEAIFELYYEFHEFNVQSLMVREARRREGWGWRLMDAAEALAKQRGADLMQVELWEFAEGPLGFYEKLGYRTTHRRMVKELESG